MTNSFFGGMPQQKGVAPQAAPSGTNSLNSDIDPVKRAKFTGYLEGMSANTVPPQPPQPPMMPPGQGMGMPPMPPMPPQGMQPPMMPQQPPMMMNMGGMVDVFDPMYMNEGGFVISTDDSGKIRTRPVFDENKGRMVSQILSRDMVNEMAQAAMAKANQPEPKIEEEIAKFIGYADKPESAIIDDSLKGVPDYTTTTIEPEESMISLPTPKPNLPMDIDMLRVGEDTDTSISLPKRKPIQLPVSKPRGDTVGDIDPFSYFDEEGPDQSLTFEKLMKPFVKPKLNVAKLIEGYDDPEELRDSAEYSNIIDDPQIADLILGSGDAVFDTPTLGNLSRNVIADRFSSDEEEEGLGLLAKILNLFRPQFTTESAGFEEIGGGEEFPPSTALRSDRFNNGGIVQGFSNGGFTSNLRAAEPERAKEIEQDRYLENLMGEYDKMYKEPISTPRDTSDDDLRRDEDQVESTGPVYDAFLKSQESMFAPIVNKIGESVFGKSPYDLYYTTQQTLKPDSMQSRLARDRLKDQDSAQRKLEEEQRLRNMIQGMMPPTDAITPAPPMVTAPDAPVADPIQPDYSSVVVPSNRVPGFDIGKISPYPQFRMPTEYNPFSSIDSGAMSDELKRLLRESISAPAVPMQQGGAVNQLGSAIDNFLNSYRQ